MTKENEMKNLTNWKIKKVVLIGSDMMRAMQKIPESLQKVSLDK